MIYLPIAHGEGKFIPQNNSVLEELQKNDQIVFRYVDAQGNFGGFPINPNGSTDHIAGICDKSGHILGLMPHPERHIQTTQGPHWTRSDKTESGGMKLFAKAVNYFC
jgi:phosphoribosylformylglycinamidine synthase